MYEIIIATHGDMAKGMLNSLQMFIEDTSHVHAICLGKEGIQAFENEVINMIKEMHGEHLLVLTDIAFASPFNVFAKQLVEYDQEYEIVAGVNLAALLEASIQRENCMLQDIVTSLKHTIQAVVYKEVMHNDIREEDE